MAKRKFSFLADENEKYEKEYQKELAEEKKTREAEVKRQLANKGKHGVSMVSGNPTPVVGEKNTYHVAGWYEDTPYADRNPEKVTWELFKKRSNGKFTSANIKKIGDGTFTFGEISIQNTYRLEAYLHKPEGGGLIINPKPSTIPKIGKVELHYVDDKKGDTFSFYDRLRAKAHTTGMPGKELVFTLWEDDAKGAGHSAGNQAIETTTAKVGHNGLAVAEFALTKGLMQKAMKGEADVKELEFYVTVEYYKGKIHDSENVNVHNPLYKAPEKKKSHPKAQGSPAEQKPLSKREEKNILIHQANGYLHDWAEVKGKAQKDKEVTVNRNHGRSMVEVAAQSSQKQEINKNSKNCYCFLQGIAKMPCSGKGSSVTDEHYQNLAKDIGVEAKVFKTVAIIESGGRKSFINYKGEQRAKILYERHYMYRFLTKIKSEDELEKLKKASPDLVHNVGTYKDPNAKYGSETEQFEKLSKAKKINNGAAIKSCSWGKFQVMGKYYSYLYSSPNELEEAMNRCEVQHFAYFKVFLKDVTGASIIKAMKDKNWNKVAELYNGEDYAKNHYHTKMKNEYNKL